MLVWSLSFLGVALIAAYLGFSGVAGVAAGAAKILFVVFLAMFVFSFLSSSFRRSNPNAR